MATFAWHENVPRWQRRQESGCEETAHLISDIARRKMHTGRGLQRELGALMLHKSQRGCIAGLLLIAECL